jgi:hypothetical protein
LSFPKLCHSLSFVIPQESALLPLPFTLVIPQESAFASTFTLVIPAGNLRFVDGRMEYL